ncbi:hypothetical protein B7494_g1334 [Chlorociboria aeruginascens]|nr:hypothetical protein B7494_g1334 [Chlorociboria aeruginascens]
MAPRSRHSTILSSPALVILCLFYLFNSAALAASAVLGVDIGTEYIKAALVKPGIPLEIVLTKDSRRKEASAVAFKPSKNPQSGEFPERLYGSDAVALTARFPGDVYPNLKSLLGLAADNSLVTDYATRHPALQLEAEKTRRTVAFRSGAFVKEEEAWAVEELLAMELQSIQKNAEALAGKGSSIKDLVITIPTFYTAEEKRAVILAAELAGLRVLELISDGLAVGLNYATSRTFPSINDGGKPEYHMVFDMGAGSTKATILKFQGRTVKDVGKYTKPIQEVEVLGSGWDRTLGGDALNAVIVDDMIAQFILTPAAKSISPSIEAVQGHGRAAAKLWKEAERLRQVLSANTHTQASFEGLYEDIDFRYKISRSDFEKLAESHAARVGPAVEMALDMAKLEVSDLDSVILHGGAIRTPFVQKELEKIIGNADKIRTNVNSDEAAVFGAGFRGAQLSPSFRVKEIRSSEGASYAASIKWKNIHEKPQHQRLWQPQSHLGAEKQYTFKNQEDFTILFYQHVASSENISPGSAEKELLSITTQNLTDSASFLKTKFGCTNSDINLKLSTRLSGTDGEVEILKMILDCEVEDTEDKGNMVDSVKGLFGFGRKDQVPLADEEELLETVSADTTSTTSTSSSISTSASASASSKDSKDTQYKTAKHFEVVDIKYTTEVKGLPQLPVAEITRMKDRIMAFDASDRSRRLREEALNQLEGFTYKARDLLDDARFIAASTAAERESLEEKSKAASDWIYSGGADASREELKAKLKEMKEIVTPIEIRKEETASRPEQIKLLQAALNQTKGIIEGIKGQIENDTKAHEAFTASKLSASASPSSSVKLDDEFEGLEDEDATSTLSAPPEEETMDPPTYTVADLIVPQNLYDAISEWLAEKLGEQEKLSETDDPVILVKDIAAKAKQLQDNAVELITKSMKRPFKSSRPKTTKSKSSTPKKTSKKSNSKTTSASPAGKTIEFGEDGTPIINEENFPSEEEILAAMEAKAKFDGKETEDKKHDEL